jgi:hypothetical protein
MSTDDLGRWLAANPLSPAHVDCATAVMLKILDGKCKMADAEKAVMARLYDCVKHHPGQVLGTTEHDLIRRARAQHDPALRELIYEKRVLAETMISRPVMKGFKAMLREGGVLSAVEME